MKPLKALILITKSNWGGAQRYVFDVATSLPKDRFSVEVRTGSNGVLIDKLIEAGIPAHGNLEVGRDVSFFKDVGAAFRLASNLRKDRPDVLHVNSSKIGGVGAFAGRLAGVKNIVFTVHGWAFNENRPFFQKLSIKSLYWMTMFFSHKVITVSEAAKNQAKNWPLVGKKIVVNHNGVSPETGFSRTNSRLELTRSNPVLKKAIEGVSETNLIWVGTVAELHHIKGHEYALHAVAECITALKNTDPKKKLIYTICGEGEERAKLETLISDLRLEGNVFLMGHVANASQYIKAFDIFMLASLSEGLAYVLIEAGAASLPVVATAVGGIPEVIGDMDSGILVRSKSSKELGHALLFMVEHPTDRKKFGTALRERVLKDFSLEKMIANIEKVYEGK